MNLIHKWLAGSRNFHVGVVLYQNLGSDKKLKELFAGVPTPHKQERLQQALIDLLSKPKIVLQPKPVDPDAEAMPESKDPVLEALHQEWLKPYSKMQYLRHQLDKYEGNSKESIEARKPIAFEILELEQQCMSVWEKRDFYLEHGRLNEDPEKNDLPDDPMALGLLYENTKRNIRRNKQRLDSQPDKAIYAVNIKKYEDLLQQIKNKLNESKVAQ